MHIEDQILSFSTGLFCFKGEHGMRNIGMTGVQLCYLFFSSRRRHTRYWRDWSSDVCSSDLRPLPQSKRDDAVADRLVPVDQPQRHPVLIGVEVENPSLKRFHKAPLRSEEPSRWRQIGRASCRERV